MMRKVIVPVLWLFLAVMLFAVYVAVRQTDYRITSFFVQFSMVVLVAFLLVLVLRYFILLFVSYLHFLECENRPDADELKADEVFMASLPKVTIVVPAYNEGKVIEASIRSLTQLNYPDLEILVVDDGSSDDTYERAKKFEDLTGEVVVKVFKKKNGGKSNALNFGIWRSEGELILSVDADSKLEPDSLIYAASHFKDPRIGAVAGNVKVINRETLICKMQALEYIQGLNMVRRAQGYFKIVNIIPGPLGLFRKSALEEVEYYVHDTFAEDCDLTIKLLGKGWKVEYEPKAVTWTEAPEDMRSYFKQRYRWTRGILQSLRKHSNYLFCKGNRLNKSILWYMVFESVVWPAMNLFAQLFFLYIVYFFNLASFVVYWWAQLTILDIVASMYCLMLEREQMRLALYSVPYRLFFVLMTDVCKVLSSLEEMLKVEMTWGKLDRAGRI